MIRGSEIYEEHGPDLVKELSADLRENVRRESRGLTARPTSLLYSCSVRVNTVCSQSLSDYLNVFYAELVQFASQLIDYYVRHVLLELLLQ